MTINGTAISMTRGDSETLTVKIKDGAFEAGDRGLPGVERLRLGGADPLHMARG